MNVAKITDFGDPAELVKEVQSRSAKTGKACELNLSEFLDAVEHEEMDEEEEGKRKKTMQKMRQNNKGGRIEAVFHTQHAEEREDEEDLAQERRLAAKKVGANMPSTRTRERKKYTRTTRPAVNTGIVMGGPSYDNRTDRQDRKFLQLKRQKKVIQVVRLEDVDANGNLIIRGSDANNAMDVDNPASTSSTDNTTKLNNEFMEVDEKGEMKVIADPWKIGSSSSSSASANSSSAMAVEMADAHTSVVPNILQPRIVTTSSTSEDPQQQQLLAKLSTEKQNRKQMILDQLQAKIASRRLADEQQGRSSPNEARITSSMPPPSYTVSNSMQGKKSFPSQEKRPLPQHTSNTPRNVPSGNFVDLTEDDDEGNTADAQPSLTTSKSGAYWHSTVNNGIKSYYPAGRPIPSQTGASGSLSSSSNVQEDIMDISGTDWRAEEEAMINVGEDATANKKGKQTVVSQETKDAINMELQRKKEIDLHKHFIQDEANSKLFTIFQVVNLLIISCCDSQSQW